MRYFLLISLFLMGCVNYDKPFKERYSKDQVCFESTVDKRAEFSKTSKERLLAQATVVCLNGVYTKAYAVKGTINCDMSVYIQDSVTCANKANRPHRIICDGTFMCKKKRKR